MKVQFLFIMELLIATNKPLMIISRTNLSLTLKNSSTKVFLTPLTCLAANLENQLMNSQKFMTGEKSTHRAYKTKQISQKIAVPPMFTLLWALCKTISARLLHTLCNFQAKNSSTVLKVPEDVKEAQSIKSFLGENAKVLSRKDATLLRTNKTRLALKVICSKTTAEWKTMFTKSLTFAWLNK